MTPASGTAPRAEAMAGRIAAAAGRAGIAVAERALLDRAFRLGMQPRARLLADDRDPEFLHPGRTMLILLEDVGRLDAYAVAAAAVCDTLRPELAAPAGEVNAALGPEVLAVAAAVPVPALAGDELVEHLVAADDPVRLVALAERLDHARHLHLRPRAEWAAFHRLTCDAYLPVALRADLTLARRYRWWCGMFERRFLR